ncbi:transcriptional regulator [Brevundimonas sp. LM2]|uniref:IclR family transcriptional regulator n=1 Tax=Brevundimonas sp. LM2 TaxID=1938605 RepID=UPI000983AACA|nr:helix-turn-helix domain-containing protein [Brevundimonas sp. LM2]AQR62342.1 transcriptional regulator [Brevundimonas sp. LM2]
MLQKPDTEDRKYRAPALEKGLDVLELLSAHGVPMTPSQMSAELGRSVSELFRMIQVLEFRGYIEPSAQGYGLTNRLFTLGMAQAPVKSLSEIALPVMRDLATVTGQSCHLVVPSGDQIVVIARIESPGDLGYSVRIGYRRNLIEATSGLLLYGCASASARERLAMQLTERFGVQKTGRFIKAAEAASDQGHVERDSDFVKGVTDLVAPIMGADGIIATLITPFIQQTPPTCDMIACMGHLREAAAAISGATGAVSQA